MQAMAEWYVKGDMDQGRLSRILDVAQDLKVTISNMQELTVVFAHLTVQIVN